MKYLAPRQGLFAIIILVSFCLQTLLLVLSTDQQLSESRAQKGEQMIAQLIDESRLSLENKDRVSLSVIANRYSSEQDVTRILIKDNNGNVLVPVGNAPMQQGNTISKIATQDDAVIGSVSLTLKDISKGEIIAMQWPFVIGSFLLHLLLWVLYGYVARPTKAQINALSHDIQALHHEQNTQNRQRHYDIHVTDSESVEAARAEHHRDDTSNDPTRTTNQNDPTATVETLDIHSKLNAYLKVQQGAATTHSDTDTADSSPDTSTPRSTIKRLPEPNHSNAKRSAARAIDSVSVQIVLHDEYNMLERLAPEMRTPYLALCTQLLNQAIVELLKQPLLLGVSAVNEPQFKEKTACAVLKADNSHAKVALAGVMLGKLYLMLNKIIHEKHIELSRFALPAKAGVSDSDETEVMHQLLQSVGKKEQMLILLPTMGLKQIGNHVQLQSLKRPTSVYERECTIFEGGNDALMQRLADVRNAVLMVDED